MMTSSTAAWGIERWYYYLLAFVISTLSVTVLLKVGEVQYLEIFFVVNLLVLGVMFARRGLRLQVFEPFASIGQSYIIFSVVAFFLGLYALQNNFYPYTFTFLKRPMLVTISRIVELFLDVFYMLLMASLYRKDEKLCRFAATIYIWVGVLGGIYSIVTFPLNILYEAQLGTYSTSHRMRGFNNEAGSYGTYMLSVITLAVAMKHRGWLSNNQFYAAMALFMICLAGSQSKGGFLAAVTLSVIHVLLSQTGARRWLFTGGVIVAFGVLAVLADIPKQIEIYAQGAASYQKYSVQKGLDGNFVLGRVAGSVLAPRMIAAHPLAGIGWGNYGMVRDDPEYRRGSAFNPGNMDAPGLGPIDYIVDLGFPLWLYLTYVSLKPMLFLRIRGADPWLLSMAMMQPISNWFGAHLNLTYPWVVVGLAMGMGFSQQRERHEVRA